MSASEVWLVARQPAAMHEADARWLERWLTETLGIRIRLVLALDVDAAHVPASARVVYAAETPPVAPARDGVRLPPPAADVCHLACLRLRQMQQSDSTVPALDEAIADIGRRLDSRWPDLARIPQVPSPYRCALVITHDVDTVDRWTSQHVMHLARHVRERLAFEGARAVLRLPLAAVRRAWDRPPVAARINACLEAEQRHQASASYLFFSPETRYRSALDGWYTPTTQYGGANLSTLWRRLEQERFDVGLHLSIGAHRDRDAVAAEWNALRTLVPGAVSCRNHYLKVVPGVTDAALVAAGIGVDLNLVATGYLYGTGAPFRHEQSDTYVLPTVIEDGELPVDDDAPAVCDRVWAKWEGVLTEARRHESVATVLVHPGKAAAPAMLERLLRWGRANDAWMTSAAGFIDHWRERVKAITAGAERAEIAPAGIGRRA